MKFPAWDDMARSSNHRAQYRHPERKRGTLTNEIIVTQKIRVTQSPNEGSFPSLRMATGGG
jgi:hypothetical protein